jgi:hypothetical protein
MASHHDLVVGSHADDQVRQFKALLLRRRRMSASASLKISPTMVATFCIDIPDISLSAVAVEEA